MAELSWGKPNIFIRKVMADGYGAFISLYTPVEESTEMSTTKGDKQEAKIEGGENEGVRYSKSTYALAATIRGAKGRKKPVKDADGIVDGEYQVFLQPENATTPGMVMLKSTISLEETYTASDGLQWVYTFDALKPDDGGDQVRWGTVTTDPETVVPGVTKVTQITFTEYGEGDEEDKAPVTFGGEKSEE
jgi:hypothetical protein